MLHQESANIVCKGPDGKYLRFGRPQGLCHNYALWFAARKQPQTTRGGMGVAVFQ